MTKLAKTLEGALHATDSNLRGSLTRVRDGAETRLRNLVRLLDRHPVGSLATAFLSGWVLARLLQKLD